MAHGPGETGCENPEHTRPPTADRGRTERTLSTLPGARAVHHIAYTVPDLEQAVSFFVDVIGAELAYRLGPVEDAEGDWMTRKLGVHPRASAHIAMLRLGPVGNLELFEYTAPDQDHGRPLNSDWGGHHFALYVD